MSSRYVSARNRPSDAGQIIWPGPKIEPSLPCCPVSAHKKTGQRPVFSFHIPYGNAEVSSSPADALKSTDIITLSAVMVKMENTNSLRAHTRSSEAL